MFKTNNTKYLLIIYHMPGTDNFFKLFFDD